MGNEDFECTRVIGKGSYGEVWLAKHKKDKKQYVLKKMNLGKASKKERKSAEQEAKLLSKLRHPNIVSYKDSFENEGFLFIAMQYCEGGDLYARLKEQKGLLLEERQVVEWFVQIAMALQYMHERNILHRDLKTQNIFLTKSKIIKVGDLGIARMLDSPSAMATTLIGTPYYMSPELFSNKPYNHKSDVWALGCCVYEMTTLKHAFNAKDMNSLVYKILKGKMPPMPCQYSSELLILMRSMLHQDPEKRPSVNRILRDPYIKKNIAIFLEDTKRNGQISQLSNRKVSVSRPPSASSSHKDSSVANLEEAHQAAIISNSDLQKRKVAENSTVKSSSSGKKSSLPDLEAASERSVELGKQPPGAGSQKAIVHQAGKEDQSSKKENVQHNVLHNHVIGSKAKHNEVSAQDTKGHGYRHNVDKPLSSQPNNSGQVVPELENYVSSSISEQANNEAEVNINDSGHDVKNPLFGHIEGNDRNLPDLQSDKKDKVQQRRTSQTAVKNNYSEPEMEAQWFEGEHGFKKLPPGQAKNKDTIFVQAGKQPLKTENKTRPLPVPRAKTSAGFPRHREDRLVSNELSRSSSVSSSAEDKESLRSLPNLSARQRRRQQKSECDESKENPTSARIKLKRAVERTASDKLSNSERSDVDPPTLRPTRQASIVDSTSSSDDSPKVTEKEGSEEKEAKRENKEINNFICVLDNTLQLIDMVESPEEDEELIPTKVEPKLSSSLSPEPATTEEEFHKSVSMPSIETLTDTSRLMHRIRMLQKDCIKGVGYSAVKEANAILNRIDEDEVEPKLINLLGKDKFDEYAGKIWQLKFCEESLFKIP